MNLSAFGGLPLRSFETCWKAPSNIAFVKYWGKKGHQLPANPSLSLTLSECTTTTKLKLSEGEALSVSLLLDGKEMPGFAQKVQTYLQGLSKDLPWLLQSHFHIETSNTFPHGTGIASSASGMAAIALCLADYLFQGQRDSDFYQTASNLARLASGSACRSLYGGFASWGEVSDEYASPLEVHPELRELCDDVLVISSAEKSVSSRAGHERMQEHPFASARFEQAKKNYQQSKAALQSGDIHEVGRILETEALTLHAMMMTSPQGFTLFRPNSLVAMEKVRLFRQETKLPLYYTLDAGPNIHLIYPENSEIKKFIQSELSPLGEKLIADRAGEGPVLC